MSNSTAMPPMGGAVPSTEDRGPALVALFWTLAAISTITIALRYVGRVMIRQVGWDDHLMAFTLFTFYGLSAFSTAMCAYGGAKHLAAIQPDDLVNALRFNWAAQAFAIFGYATGKISIGLLILRIVGPNTKVRKWLLYVSLSLSVLFSVIDIILTFAQCQPTAGLWNPMLVASGKAVCWDSRIQSDFALFLGVWNIVVDTLLAILPVTIFYNLKISLMQKLSCSVLLGLGLLAAVFGAIKAATLGSLNARSDLTWETFPLFAWSGAELFVLMFCGSVPPMKPLYDRVFRPERLNRTRGYTAHTYGQGGGATGAAVKSVKKGSKWGVDDSVGSTVDNDRRHLNGRDEEYEIGQFQGGKNSPNGGRGIIRTTEVSVTSHQM